MSTVITILVALLIFGVLITSHEFGHFLAARKCGVEVEEFSAGMGPLLWQKKTPKTDYSLRLFPIGGYCKMKGEDEEDTDGEPEPGSLNAAPPLKRIIIMASGALMNFVAAILIFFAIYCISGTDATTTIASFTAVSPASKAGIEIGDKIVAINGSKISEWDDITSFIRDGDGSIVSVTVEKKSGGEATYDIEPYYSEEDDAYLIGITPKVKTDIFKAFGRAFYMLGYMIKAIWDVFVGLFRGNIGLEAFSGPIGATVVIGQYIPQGLIYVLSIAGSISVSLGFFNLLPIPALDGSRILFALIELIAGKPINRKIEGKIHLIGFAVLLAFAVFVAYRDIINFF